MYHVHSIKYHTALRNVLQLDTEVSIITLATTEALQVQGFSSGHCPVAIYVYVACLPSQIEQEQV